MDATSSDFNPDFKVPKKGQIYQNYSEWENAKEIYESINFVQIWKRDARTIETLQRRAPKKHYNKDLVYGDLKYCCIHGGRSHKPTSTGTNYLASVL